MFNIDLIESYVENYLRQTNTQTRYSINHKSLRLLSTIFVKLHFKQTLFRHFYSYEIGFEEKFRVIGAKSNLNIEFEFFIFRKIVI